MRQGPTTLSSGVASIVGAAATKCAIASTWVKPWQVVESRVTRNGVAGGDVALDLHLRSPAEMRPDRHGKIDDAHAGAHSAAWRRSDSCPICALSAAPVSSALAACRSAKTMAAASGRSAISGRTAMIAAKRSRPRSIVSP